MSKKSFNSFFYKEFKKSSTGNENEFTYLEYDELLNLNRKYLFNLLQRTVSTEADFNIVKKAAVDTLKQDLCRFEEDFFEIDPALKNRLIGTIGALVLMAQDNGKVKIRFHKRNKKGIWDNYSKTYPEKFVPDSEKENTKFRYELFFALEDEE